MAEREDALEKSMGISEILYKVLVVGNFGVGKTSIIRRYTSGVFSAHYKLTIGVDFALKTLTWDENTRINMQLWDIAGHERFGHMTRVYYKYAIAAIVVFDLSRQPTFESVPKWLDDVRQKVVLENDEPVPVLLLANKSDLPEGIQVHQEQLDRFCEENNIIAWFPTSAKDNINIEEAMSFLVERIMQISTKEPQNAPSPTRDMIDGVEDTDGLVTLVNSQSQVTNGHVPKSTEREKSDCCV